MAVRILMADDQLAWLSQYALREGLTTLESSGPFGGLASPPRCRTGCVYSPFSV